MYLHSHRVVELPMYMYSSRALSVHVQPWSGRALYVYIQHQSTLCICVRVAVEQQSSMYMYNIRALYVYIRFVKKETRQKVYAISNASQGMCCSLGLNCVVNWEMGAGVALGCPLPPMLTGISITAPYALHAVCLLTFLTNSMYSHRVVERYVYIQQQSSLCMYTASELSMYMYNIRALYVYAQLLSSRALYVCIQQQGSLCKCITSELSMYMRSY